MRAILVPVKSFRKAKHRLEPVLDDRDREALARRLAQVVVDVNGSTDLFVACDDGEVADWAAGTGAFVLWTPGLGLSGAVATGVEYVARHGFDLAVVAHADLPKMTSLREFGEDGAVTIAPDRQLDGSNVIAIPTGSGFRFSYGSRSFRRHCEEAARVGLALRVVYDPNLAADVDVPADLIFAETILDAMRTERADATLGERAGDGS